MNFLSTLSAASFFTFFLLFGSARVQAQPLVASASTTAAVDSEPDKKSGRATEASASESVVLVGKITNPAGPLPGAVVILTDTKQMAVTNADGEFQFEVPASAGELNALVTYAGYADEKMVLNAAATSSTVSMTNARVISVSRKYQLKTYLKTARKQAKRSLKQVRKK
ncbi:carboxypeptidase-like regulatory domain-containing protein [Hymenobacter sp. BT175]|uniref:carboxypeptidase regulatory-like domain-containing protein n=1 Tax=Hymenobacter translucens TaxID=2886507 RepID=UPI001D0EAB2D|nr:carboxypeptidase regulatory-like domain-containing protein [Hymenobacter translucens]MCC2544836.1 carboxypeptidase-like regulatory domain-containing protein [Hymenobacter translucens]